MTPGTSRSASASPDAAPDAAPDPARTAASDGAVLPPELARLLHEVGASPEVPPSPEAWRALVAALGGQQRRIDSERVEQAALMRATLESSAEGVCVIDDAWRVVAVNRQFVELTGLPAAILETRDARELLEATMRVVKNADEVRQRIVMLHDTDITAREEVELTNGLRIDVCNAPVRMADGAKLGRVTFVRDVTDERRQRRDLEQAREAAEAASQAKSMFLANMSHELRTPLNAVIGLADLLMLERDPLVDRQREYLSGIASSGRHLLALVNDVLDLAKIEAGKQELTLEPIRIHDAIEEGMAAILPLAKARGVMLEPATIVAVPNVRADPMRLRQILYNLISNAVKFTNRNGVVRIRARRDGERVSISVIDTGVGIAPADLSRLYRTFEQLRLPSGDRPPGTGLGLALTKRLVEMHGGTIDVESQLGVGTTFTVKIPAVA